SWVEVIIALHGGVIPADDEGFDRGEVAENGFDGKSEWFFVGSEHEQGVGVAAKDAGTALTVNGLFCCCVAFGEVMGVGDTSLGFDGEFLEGIEKLGNISCAIF